MELGTRKAKVLEAIVNSYIVTGEPVSSKSLCDNLKVSSSTVRNDMAELTQLGLLEQIHASSGRVPSHAGYRLYIDQLMSQGASRLTIESKEELSRPLFSCKINDPEDLLRGALDVVAEYTKCAAVSAVPSKSCSGVRAIRLIIVGHRSIMVVLVASAGVIRNKIVLCDCCFNQEELVAFQRILQDNLEGLEVRRVPSVLAEAFDENFAEVSPVLCEIVEAVIDLSDEISGAEVDLTGESNLFFYPDFDLDSVSGVIDFLNSPDQVLSFLKENQDDDVSVLVGEESKLCEFGRFSVIISKYDFSRQDTGFIAIVGPTRMDYAKIIPSMKYLSSLISKFLNENFGL
ncbi:MAG: heat-inducible transcriptional repressor HrcA [Oscillospiraceae bacterium]|nr:heat-inducible transcriptional repressor HrcA [Oscillospiraceae bacterium]